MHRRRLLQRGGVVLAFGLAGCVGGDGDHPTPTPTEKSMEPMGPADTASPTPTATATPEPTASPSPTPGDVAEPTETPTAGPSPTPTASDNPDQEVIVGPDGSLSFAPSSFSIDAGAIVRWTWDSSNHNVRPRATPGDADWNGTEGGDSTTYNAGHTYSYTFTVTGEYEYYCAPHRAAGMTGSFAVE